MEGREKQVGKEEKEGDRRKRKEDRGTDDRREREIERGVMSTLHEHLGCDDI